MNRTSRMIRIAIACGLLLALGLLAACAQTPSAATPSGDSDTSTPAAAPTVALVTPANGATLSAGDIDVAVETTGIEFVMPGGDNVAGEGHVHFTLDDRAEQMSVEKEAVIKSVTSGTHVLVAELVGNDTEPLDPPVKQEIVFVVE